MISPHDGRLYHRLLSVGWNPALAPTVGHMLEEARRQAAANGTKRLGK